MIQELILI